MGHYDPPATVGVTHTAMPLFSRCLLVVSAERASTTAAWTRPSASGCGTSTMSGGRGPWPPRPTPANAADLLRCGGRFGTHNIWENRPRPLAFHSGGLVLGSFFAGGVQVYDISDPARPRKVAYNVPAAPPGRLRGAS